MNILPFVTGFLLILGFVGYSALQQYVSTSLAATKVSAQYSLEHQALSAKQKKAYKKHRSPPQKTRQAKTLNPDKNYLSPRLKSHYTYESKLNLAPLLEEENPQLFNLAVENVKLFYIDIKQERAEKIIKTLLTLAKEHPETTSLDDLFTFVETDRKYFAKFFQGTQEYQPNTTKGIAPLGDFLCFEKEKKALQIAHTNWHILNATFGTQVARAIHDKERQKWEREHKHTPITKSEFAEIAQHLRLNLAPLEPLLDFSISRTETKSALYEDEKSKMKRKI